MELRHLRYFVAVAEEQNVTRAAARLHVSQPPLTRQIHDLEEELGFALFARTGKALRLTEAGRVFLEETRVVLQRLDTAVAAGRAAATGGGELQVGYAPSPTANFLPGALRAFQRKWPGVRVRLHDQTTPEMLAGLRDRSLHVALLMQPPRAAMTGLAFEPLGTHRMVVALSRAHPFASRRGLALTDLLREPIVAFARRQYPDYHALLARVLGRSYEKLRIVEECDGGMSLIAAVEGGRGVAITIEGLAETAGKRLRFVPFVPPLLPAVVGVAYPEGETTPVLAGFLDAVRAKRKT